MASRRELYKESLMHCGTINGHQNGALLRNVDSHCSLEPRPQLRRRWRAGSSSEAARFDGSSL
jgi:hypothetical protein